VALLTPPQLRNGSVRLGIHHCAVNYPPVKIILAHSWSLGSMRGHRSSSTESGALDAAWTARLSR
jgi:hypothetical protein